MASTKQKLPETEKPEPKKAKFTSTDSNSLKSGPKSHVGLNPADCNLDFNVEENALQGSALCQEGFSYCWSGARGNVGITRGKYCFGCKVISEQPVEMVDTPLDQQHLCRVGISRGDDSVGSLGESWYSFGFGGTGKFSNSGKFSNYGEKFGVGDTIVCAVDLDSKPFGSIGFSKNEKWLGIARDFNVSLNGLGMVDSPGRKLEWESALFPHVLLKNVVVHMQFSVEDGLVPVEGYKPWSSAVGDGNIIMGPSFLSPKECEVMMMIGLPASGKTTWAEKWVKEHPEKRYVLLGTNLALDQMKVPGLLRKQNYGERFDRLMDRATGIFNTLLARAAKTSRNYILDQTNVYKSARKRKLKAFINYRKIAVVMFPTPDGLKFRGEKRFKEMGKEVPAEAVNEMLANYVLPTSKDMPGADEFFDEVMFPELKRGEAQRHLEEMKRALGPFLPNAKSDFSPYSRESSVQSFASSPIPNRGALSAGAHWQNFPPHLPPLQYDFPRPQQVSPVSGTGLYGKPEISTAGYRSASGETHLSIATGNSPNYRSSSLPGDQPHPYGTCGGYDPYIRSNFESRSPIPRASNDPYQRSSGVNDVYSSPNVERQSSFGRPLFESPRSSISRPDFNSRRSSLSYSSHSAHLSDPRMHPADPLAPMHPPPGPRSPFSATYRSPYGRPPPRPPYGNFPPMEQQQSDRYPPGSRYY